MYILVGFAFGYILGVISMVVISILKKPPEPEIYDRSGPVFIKKTKKRKPKVNDDQRAFLKENDNIIGG